MRLQCHTSHYTNKAQVLGFEPRSPFGTRLTAEGDASYATIPVWTAQEKLTLGQPSLTRLCPILHRETPVCQLRTDHPTGHRPVCQPSSLRISDLTFAHGSTENAY